MIKDVKKKANDRARMEREREREREKKKREKRKRNLIARRHLRVAKESGAGEPPANAAGLVDELRDLTAKLPRHHHATLAFLMHHLRAVAHQVRCFFLFLCFFLRRLENKVDLGLMKNSNGFAGKK